MSTTSAFFPLVTEGSVDDGAPEYHGPNSDAGTESGASGESQGGNGISKGGLIAIIVVVVVVSVIGISTAVLFYLTKKKEWKIRESLRKSARRVVTALTPRRSEFPKELKDPEPRSKSRRNADNVPPTPRISPDDIEKGLELAEAKRKQRRWGR